MKPIKSLDEFKRRKAAILENSYNNAKIRIKVHMGTSSVASGAEKIYDFISVELEKRNIDADVIKTGDFGFSFAEPTIEVTRPGEEPVIFGNVDMHRADDIIEKYIKIGEYIDGILPVNYRTISF